ncbi:hypothetical protein V496_05947 [Pseudogymnoascus sp. VKM F-4515 (FW-2607)]|nr:hypothetical protein V496_05947 [Pseudogymnoascus sp. VKM F-4515 (FW-2607)]KFY78656.1 hypothetical protein V498_09063 [Pseudogymnoascus sp. VKM F-4517 (FW-2822)]
METITIVNKSGKIVGTSKHLLNIFKEAKSAYQDKRAEIRAEIHGRNEEKLTRKLENLRLEETRSVASSGRSHRSHKSRRPKHEGESSRRPATALTERNLAAASEASGSVAGSRHGGSRPATSHRSPTVYQGPYQPYVEDYNASRPTLVRHHTDFPPRYEPAPMVSVAPRHDYHDYPPPPPLQRSMTSPNPHHADDIDMNMAYGELPPDLAMQVHPAQREQREQELNGLMSKLDHLMVEAHCVQHTATTIIASLQKNPEAMAAVALTLAEISNVLTKMGPGFLTAIKGSSPAIFALLCSPQFLIAGGVAVGVTIVMFGGYKIIKKIQKEISDKKEADESYRMDEAMVFNADNYSIESWRQGIAEVQAPSVSTSVDGEYITPKAEILRKQRIRDRAMEERNGAPRSPSVGASSNASTVRRKPVPVYMDSSRTVVTESARTERSSRTSKTTKSRRTSKSERSESTVKPKKEGKDGKEKKPKKQSAISVLFKGSSSVKKDKSVA